MSAARKFTELPGYQLTGRLGDGGMATVYKGTQISLKRPVAIKILKSNLLNHREIRKLFKLESFIIARLSHPNIINVIDQGITPDGQPYFIMNYVKGRTLDQVTKSGDLSPNQAIDIFIQIAKALAYAHKNRIIHCDIKPQNIIVDEEGTAQVLDFGIAQIFKKMDGQDGKESEFIMGSPNYMAPEQHESSTKVTKKSDLYALGVIMYQFFSGRLPKIGEDLPPQKFNPSLSNELNDLIMSCLAVSQYKRPKSADDLKNQLLYILQGKHLNQEQHQRAGKDLTSNFSLLDVIKESKYGSVYLFQERKTCDFFIIKKKPLWGKGFEASQAISKMEHPNINRILGTSKNQKNFIVVSDYCSGGTLSDRLSRPFTLNEFYPLVITLCETLSTTHSDRIVHGNLRPTNILFDGTGVVKITDFGLDEHYENQEPHENWYSLPNEEASEAFDIYSMGVIFHQMLTGELPIRKYSKFVPGEAFNYLPDELQSLILDMLKLDPSKRIPSFFALTEELYNLSGGDNTVVMSKNVTESESPTLAAKKAEEQKKNHSNVRVAPAIFAGLFVYILFIQVALIFPDLFPALKPTILEVRESITRLFN